MTDFLAGFYGGLALGWIVSQLVGRRRSYWLDYHRRRRSNTPPPSGPQQPLAADMIRYSRWRDEQIRRAVTEPTRFNEGPIACSTNRAGPTTHKPPMKPTPQVGRLIRLENPDLQLMDQPGCVPKPEFPPPREIPGDTP